MLVLMFTLTIVSCKKDKVEKKEEEKRPSIVGAWANVTPVGSFRNILTNIEFKENGTGNEYVVSITNFSSTEISDLDFSWTEEKNNTINLTFEDGLVEKYTYTLDVENNLLVLISESGNSKEYFKDID